MPIDYKLRNLRRLFGEASFFRPSQIEGAPPARGKVARVARMAAMRNEKQDDSSTSRTGRESKRVKQPGGVPRAFFTEQPPRSVKNKAVSGQLNVVHLFEKQKMKMYYGAMRDGKFKKYVDEAKSKRFNTDAVLLRLLELRLDTFLYRTGFVKTPNQGRQWIFHNLVLINGKRVNIKSYQVRPGDMLTLKECHMERAMQICYEVAEMRSSFGCNASWIVSRPDAAGMLPWMEIDRAGLSAILVREPTDDEARSMARAALFPYIRDANMNPHLAMRAYR